MTVVSVHAPPASGARPVSGLARRHGGRPFAGTARLVRLIVRRDRIRLSLWVVGLVALMTVSAQSIASLYGSPDEIATYVDTVGENPALVIFGGPGYGFDEPNTGVILVNETTLWMALAVALMSVFLVTRHTRTEEESERMDLLRALVVGRHAHLAAAMVVVVSANVLVAAGCAVAASAFGFDAAGSVALGAGIGLVGCAFAAATAVAVQVASTGRAALGLAAGSVALAFVVRGIGDVSAPVLSWTTPFGWGIGIRAFAGERWWTLLGLAAATLIWTAVALEMSVRRDLGGGMLRDRAGPDHAPRSTCRPLGLAARLQRNVVLGWTVGVGLAGLVYGSVADDIEAMVADNPELADYLARVSGATLAESYLATTLRIVALAVAGFAVSSALRARAEEAAGRAEPLLATPVSRERWLGGQLVVTAGATVLLTLVSGLATGVAYAATVGDWSQVVPLTLASLATLPPVLVLVGFAVAAFGWVPHAVNAVWAVFAFCAVASVFGTVLQMPAWMIDLSPFELAPGVPAEPWAVTPLVAMTAAAAGLVALGFAGFHRRDLATA